jgi:hypothetical protein
MHRQYMAEIHRNLGYLGTWFPNLLVGLGDIVTFDATGFTRIGAIGDRGIHIRTKTNDEASSYDYASRGAVTITISGGVKGNHDKTKGAITVKFSQSDAILFQALGCHSAFIENQDDLAREIEFKYKHGDWPKDHFIVTEVIAASGATIVISSSDEARLDLIARGALSGGKAPLADVNAGIEVASSSHVSLQIVAEKHLTPLFKARGMIWTLLGGRRWGWRDRGSDREGPRLSGESTASVDFLTPEYMFGID